MRREYSSSMSWRRRLTIARSEAKATLKSSLAWMCEIGRNERRRRTAYSAVPTIASSSRYQKSEYCTRTSRTKDLAYRSPPL